MKQSRILPITGTAIAMTFGIFYTMHSLVATGDVRIEPDQKRTWIEFVQRDTPPEAREIERLVKPEPPKALPKRKEPPRNSVPGDGPTILVGPAPGPIEPSGPHITLAQLDGERIPLVRVQPTYPRRCQERGLSGWVMLEFDVDELGMVDRPQVIGADPSGCFDRAALKTIKRFKYKPTVRNGEAQRSHGMRFRMVFSMTET